MGESNSLFPISVAHPDVTRVNEYHFPVLTTWKVCDYLGSVFLNARPESDATDVEGRDMLWALYDILRTGFCIYANRLGPRIEIVGDGIGATAEATIVESVITGITVTNPGTGYTSAVAQHRFIAGPDFSGRTCDGNSCERADYRHCRNLWRRSVCAELRQLAGRFHAQCDRSAQKFGRCGAQNQKPYF